MKTLYLDLFSGISGDMFLGAMLDLGLDESYLREQLALLDVGDYELRIHRSSRSSVEGVKFDVLLNAPQNPPDQNVSSHGVIRTATVASRTATEVIRIATEVIRIATVAWKTMGMIRSTREILPRSRN